MARRNDICTHCFTGSSRGVYTHSSLPGRMKQVRHDQNGLHQYSERQKTHTDPMTLVLPVLTPDECIITISSKAAPRLHVAAWPYQRNQLHRTDRTVQESWYCACLNTTHIHITVLWLHARLRFASFVLTILLDPWRNGDAIGLLA